MNAIAKTFAVAVVGMGLVGAGAEEASANWAVTEIHNHTNVTITYAYRWGESGDWNFVTLLPGQGMSHYVPYNGPNSYVPWLYVKFDADNGPAYVEETYKLASYASYNTSEGKRYAFEPAGGWFIDLYYLN